MPTMANYELCCPRCKMKADFCLTQHFTDYSVRRLELPVFLCSACQLICVDKPTVRRFIDSWYHDSIRKEKVSLKAARKEFLGKLNELVNSYFVKIGYKRTRFIKREK